jgi:hypothetical protein
VYETFSQGSIRAFQPWSFFRRASGVQDGLDFLVSMLDASYVALTGRSAMAVVSLRSGIDAGITTGSRGHVVGLRLMG